jgi:hypothetical protein
VSSEDEAAQALAAPWYGLCGACGRGTCWYGDSEEEVRGRIAAHMAAEHVTVWRNGGDVAGAA